MLPIGSPKANWSQARGQTKYGSKYPMKNGVVRQETLPGGSPGPTSGARPGRRARERAPCRSATGPGQAQPKRATWHFSLPHPVDPQSAGETAGVGCAATWVAVVVMGLSDPDLGCRG